MTDKLEPQFLQVKSVKMNPVTMHKLMYGDRQLMENSSISHVWVVANLVNEVLELERKRVWEILND